MPNAQHNAQLLDDLVQRLTVLETHHKNMGQEIHDMKESVDELLGIFRGSKMVAAVIKWAVGVGAGACAIAGLLHWGGK